jgi:hypothetical protein
MRITAVADTIHSLMVGQRTREQGLMHVACAAPELVGPAEASATCWLPPPRRPRPRSVDNIRAKGRDSAHYSAEMSAFDFAERQACQIVRDPHVRSVRKTRSELVFRTNLGISGCRR